MSSISSSPRTRRALAPETQRAPQRSQNLATSRDRSSQGDSARLSRERREAPARRSVGTLLNGLSSWAEEASSDSPDTERSARLELGEGQFLRQGSRSEQVTQVQEMLRQQGFELEVDGVFGPETQGMVREFQSRHNLEVDGVIGPQTQAALNGALGSETAAQQGEPEQTGAEAGPTENRETPAPEAAQRTPAGNSTTTLQGLPERAEGAMTGSAFLESIRHLPPGRERNQAVLREIMGGNIPDNARQLQEVVMNSGGREIRLNAMPDYLAIGSNEDNVRVPMTPAVAQAIADRTGTSLPTTAIVDAIHSQAQQLHLAPFGDAPGAQGIGHYGRHDQRIDDQLGSGLAPTQFVSGHKKDLVIPARDGRVAIYGGSWANGSRVQSYSNVHGDSYEDYSHGVRLVSQEITVDGQGMRLEDALADPTLRALLSPHSGSFRY